MHGIDSVTTAHTSLFSSVLYQSKTFSLCCQIHPVSPGESFLIQFILLHVLRCFCGAHFPKENASFFFFLRYGYGTHTLNQLSRLKNIFNCRINIDLYRGESGAGANGKRSV